MASFAAAYGLRIRAPGTRLPWPEFTALLAGLPADTPLAQLIAIRQASDKEAESLGESARQARADWQMRLAERAACGNAPPTEQLELVFRSLFGKKQV